MLPPLWAKGLVVSRCVRRCTIVQCLDKKSRNFSINFHWFWESFSSGTYQYFIAMSVYFHWNKWVYSCENRLKDVNNLNIIPYLYYWNILIDLVLSFHQIRITPIRKLKWLKILCYSTNTNITSIKYNNDMSWNLYYD